LRIARKAWTGFSRALPRICAESFNMLGDTPVRYISFTCPNALTRHNAHLDTC
jgi:hypothetical protein